MYLVRSITRSYDEVYEVELTDDMISRIEEMHNAFYDGDPFPFDFDDLGQSDMSQIWSYLSEMHAETGQVITLAGDWGNELVGEEEVFEVYNDSVIPDSVKEWA